MRMGDRKTIIALLITLVLMLMSTAKNNCAADASVDVINKHQTIEGFGGGLHASGTCTVQLEYQGRVCTQRIMVTD
jgi:O-glycosyl hydrolase